MVPISFYWLLRDPWYLVKISMYTDVNIWTTESHFWCPENVLVDHEWFLVIDFPCFLLAVGEIYLWEFSACSHIGVLLWHITTSNTECDIMFSDPLSYRSMASSYSCENDGKNERCNLPSNIFILLVHSVKGNFKCDRKDSWVLFTLRPYSTCYTHKGIAFT